MATRILGPTGSRRRRRFLLGPLLLVALAALLVTAGAQAVHDVGVFELDADAANTEATVTDNATAGLPDDWDRVCHTATAAFTTPLCVSAADDHAIARSFDIETDAIGGANNASIFTGGGSKDPEALSQWKWKDQTGGLPDKDNLLHAMAARYSGVGTPSGEYLFFGADRWDNSGDAQIGFWFFKNKVTQNPNGTFSGVHAVGQVPHNNTNTGDLLVLSDFTQGGTQPTIQIYEYVGSGGSDGSLNKIAGGTTDIRDCATVGSGDAFCASVNPNDGEASAWPYRNKSGETTFAHGEFYEGGINLTSLGFSNQCFSSFLTETRSSQSTTATLKDFVLGNFQPCSATISITPSAVNRVGEPHTFTVNVSRKVGNVSTPAPNGTVVNVTLTTANGAVVSNKSDNCVSPGTVSGSCTVSFTSNSTGTVTGHAAATVTFGGESFSIQTDGQAGNSGDAVKRFVDAKIAIAPDDVNRAGDSHTFTVTLSKDVGNGSGFVAASGEHVSFTLSDSNGAANIVDAAASTCDNAGANTDSNGKCTIVFKSNSTGLVTATASSTLSITTAEGTKSISVSTDGTGKNSGSAKKRFVDAKIAIAPDAVNRAGETHTFTVTLSKDLGNGSGFVAASGEHVSFTLSGSSGATAIVDNAASSCDDAGANTDSNGKCTIVFKSNSTGLVTGSASATLSITTTEGTQSISVSTDGAGSNSATAKKRFVDAKIAIAPDDVNRVGESHTFIVTLSKDLGTGSGFVAASGDHVDFTLSAGALLDAAASTCDNAGANTDINGKCTIVFSSNVTGLVTGNASSTVSITTTEGTESISVSTDGTGNNSGSAKKRFVDAKIAIAPDDVNGITESHTFTVTLSKDAGDGSGFVAASGEHVTVVLTPSGGASAIVNAAASTCDNAGANTDNNGKCTIVFTSNSAGTITGSASATLSISTPQGSQSVSVSTDGTGKNSGPATKVFVAGTIAWTKVDNSVPPQLLGGATFQVCRTHRLDSSTDPDSFVAEASPVCVTVADDVDGTSGQGDVDRDPDAGEFLLVDQILGKYTVKETIAPAGYALDPDTVQVQIDLDNPNAVIAEAFVDVRLFKLIVITCNESTDTLVDSEVVLDGVTKDTITQVPAHLPITVTEHDMCAIGGASYGALTAGNYSPAVELPDVAPLHP